MCAHFSHIFLSCLWQGWICLYETVYGHCMGTDWIESACMHQNLPARNLLAWSLPARDLPLVTLFISWDFVPNISHLLHAPLPQKMELRSPQLETFPGQETLRSFVFTMPPLLARWLPLFRALVNHVTKKPEGNEMKQDLKVQRPPCACQAELQAFTITYIRWWNQSPPRTRWV